jgi:UrcA family protein
MTIANVDLKLNRRIGAALAVIAGCIVAAASHPADAATRPDDVPSMTVKYADLDIASEDGARILYRRIARAAAHVCPRADNRDLDGLALSQACQQQSIARAVQAVSSARLAAVHAEHSKHI